MLFHMGKYKAVIFDLDGVLVTTDHYHYKAWKKIADKFEIPFDEEVNHRLRGVSRLDSLNIILENSEVEFSNAEKMNLSEEKNEFYKKYLQKLTPSNIDVNVLLTLKKLKEKDLKLAIGSSSKNAEFILRRTNLMSYFDAISDGNNVEKSKPNPEVFLKAAEFLGQKPENCIIVEDAVSGILAGNRAGMKTVAIGHARTSDLADYKIDSLKKLVDIV